ATARLLACLWERLTSSSPARLREPQPKSLGARSPLVSAHQPDRMISMPTIVVHVMPKPEILDPQGKAVGAALPRLGFDGFAEVRQGKRFELTVDGEVTDELLAQ